MEGPPQPVDPEGLFAGWLARPGTEEEFEALCREHVALASALRQLRADWTRLQSILRRAGLGISAEQGHSFAKRLKEQYGSGVDPDVALDRTEEPTPPSSQLLKRLAEHTLKGSRYQLKGELARGGMGAILKVWDEDLRRSLAMKVILGKAEAPSTGTPPVDKRLLARFLEEAQVTGQLDHPGIVPVHELGLDAEGRVYFTMKLVKGRDLKAIFDLVFEKKDGWNETRALGVILKVCEAMAYAHAKGVVHRDLKPANIMVGNFGEVFVMDWGLARVLGREDQHDLRLRPEDTNLTSVKTERREERSDAPDSPILTMDGDIVGTPAYMPPEQARGEIEKIGPHSDVYAIGAVLYHLLARQMPFVPVGARITNRMILGMVVQGLPAPLTTLRKDIPAELVAICEKAMAREPARRYRDTLELAEDLRAYLERRVVRAYRTGALVVLRKWVQRNPALACSLVAAVLVSVVATITMTRSATRTRVAQAAAERSERIRAQERVLVSPASTRAEKNSVLRQIADDILAGEATQDDLRRFMSYSLMRSCAFGDLYLSTSRFWIWSDWTICIPELRSDERVTLYLKDQKGRLLQTKEYEFASSGNPNGTVSSTGFTMDDVPPGRYRFECKYESQLLRRDGEDFIRVGRPETFAGEGWEGYVLTGDFDPPPVAIPFNLMFPGNPLEWIGPQIGWEGSSSGSTLVGVFDFPASDVMIPVEIALEGGLPEGARAEVRVSTNAGQAEPGVVWMPVCIRIEPYSAHFICDVENAGSGEPRVENRYTPFILGEVGSRSPTHIELRITKVEVDRIEGRKLIVRSVLPDSDADAYLEIPEIRFEIPGR